VDPNKIKDMLEWPIPKIIKILRGFLGITGYYKTFVKNYRHVATPLTTLLKKDDFQCNELVDTTFERLKEAM